MMSPFLQTLFKWLIRHCQVSTVIQTQQLLLRRNNHYFDTLIIIPAKAGIYVKLYVPSIPNIMFSGLDHVAYTHLTLPTIYSV